MTLGERLVRLRNQKGLSQDALAEQLGVSRQSVSKWETDTSVPELDKLLKLSDLFEVSLDELVKGKAVTPSASDSLTSPTALTAEDLRIHRQKIAGIVLMAVSAALTLLFRYFSFLTLQVFVLGLLCLLVRRRLALALGWTAWIFEFAITQYGTSINMAWLLSPNYWKVSLPLTLILAFVQLIALCFLTWQTFRNPPGLLACWLIWAGLFCAIYPLRFFRGGKGIRLLTLSYYQYSSMGAILLWCHIFALFWLIHRTWKHRRGIQAGKKSPE